MKYERKLNLNTIKTQIPFIAFLILLGLGLIIAEPIIGLSFFILVISLPAIYLILMKRRYIEISTETIEFNYIFKKMVLRKGKITANLQQYYSYLFIFGVYGKLRIGSEKMLVIKDEAREYFIREQSIVMFDKLIEDISKQIGEIPSNY